MVGTARTRFCLPYALSLSVLLLAGGALLRREYALVDRTRLSNEARPFECCLWDKLYDVAHVVRSKLHKTFYRDLVGIFRVGRPTLITSKLFWMRRLQGVSHLRQTSGTGGFGPVAISKTGSRPIPAHRPAVARGPASESCDLFERRFPS